MNLRKEQQTKKTGGQAVRSPKKRREDVEEKVIEELPYNFLEDREFLHKVLAHHHIALKHAAPELRKDRDFVLRAVAINGAALQHVPSPVATAR